MITVSDGLQLLGGLLAVGGSVMIAYAGLPKWQEVRHHGTYGSAPPIREAMGRQFGYQSVSLVVIILGGVLTIVALAPMVSRDRLVSWATPVLAGLVIILVGHFVGGIYAARISRDWARIP